MMKHTQTEEKSLESSHNASQRKIAYYFTCACGCGQMSELLGKGYIKLRKSQKWYAKGCEGKLEIIQEFKNGFIVKQEDF